MLFVGLGNPGKQYELTRHNVGFIILDNLSENMNLQWKDSKKFTAHVTETNFKGKKIYFCKPQTYMNLSGESVQKISSYYNIPLSDIVVFHDDLDLNLGRIKFKTGGGSAGHNGLKSIDLMVGNNYNRIRIGIGKPENNYSVSSYVLSKFSDDEFPILENVIKHISSNIENLINKNYEKFSIII